MSRRTRMSAAADLLADPGLSVEEVTLLAVVRAEVTDLINESIDFCLIADNIDRPDAEKYGTHPDGSPRHAPEWYVAQGIQTAIIEGLHGALSGVLSCEEVDEHGHVCVGSLMHGLPHWDGDGCNWGEER